MVVGLLPMMFAFGVGAHGNRTLGTAAIGGMFIGMIFQIFIVPVFVCGIPVLAGEIQTYRMGRFG